MAQQIDPEVSRRDATYHWSDVVPEPVGLGRIGCDDDLLNAFEAVMKEKSKQTAYHPDEHETKKSNSKSYTRVVPEKYTGISGDSFMHKLIVEHAIEGGKAQGKPNGQFWFEPAGARAAAKDVIVNYLHVPDAVANDMVCSRFWTIWRSEDPANLGKIEADRMPRFFRALTGIHLNL